MISVIVPVYNSEKTIGKCVESILSQSCRDFELILVDDGSTDDSFRLCSEYTYDTRVTVIHKENGGVSSARNAGLDHAKGEWVSFVDSDDYLDDNFFEILYGTGRSELNITGFCGSGSDSPSCVMALTAMENSLEVVSSLFETRLVSTPWAKLFKRSIIEENGLRFDENVRIGEDTLFVWDYISKIGSVELIPGSAYHFTGIYGGEVDKYKMSYGDFEYRTKRLVSALRGVNHKWNTSVPYSCCWSILHLDSLYDSYTDRDIYEIYRKLIQSDVSFRQFISSPTLNPARNLIVRAKNHYRDGKYREGYTLLRKLDKYCNGLYLTAFPPVDRIVCFLSVLKVSFISALLLYVYSIIKK